MEKKPIFIEVKDHSVSGERFQLLYDEQLEMLETFPKPALDKLPEYYQSEDYISHTDSKRNLLEKVYHLVRDIALKRKLYLINKVSNKGKHLLDIGCGTGEFLQTAKKNNWTVVGIEPNKIARQLANQKTNNKVFESTNFAELEPESFDVITLWHVLEHLPNLDDQISLFKKFLKPNGTLFIAVPNYKSFDASYYKEFWAAFDAPRHLWHFSKNSIAVLMSRQSLVIKQILPMKFDAYYVSLLSEKYRNGQMNPIKAFWMGWRSNFKASRSGEYSSLIYVIENGK